MSSFLFEENPQNAIREGDRVVNLDAQIRTREQLFERLAEQLGLPEYFGGNWDALDESLRDLHWVAERRVVLVHNDLPALPDEALRTYLDIVARAVEDWQKDPEHEVVAVFPDRLELEIRAMANLKAPN